MGMFGWHYVTFSDERQKKMQLFWEYLDWFRGCLGVPQGHVVADPQDLG